MASETIAHSALEVDSEPIQARGIIGNNNDNDHELIDEKINYQKS